MRIPRNWLILLLGVLIVVWSEPPAALHAQAPTSLDEYHNIVARVLAQAQQALTLAPSERPALLTSAADALSKIEQVQTPSGALVNVNNADLIAILRDSNRTDEAVARLGALESVLAAPLPVIDPASVAVLHDLLNRPPFVRQTAIPWWQDIVLQILAFLDRLFENTAQGVFEVRDLLILAALVVVIGVLIYFVRNLRRNLVTEESLPGALLQDRARTPAEAFDNAQRYINAGDYRSAVRQLYLATLFLLDRHGRIKYDPTLTNREYLRQTKNDARTTAALEPIVEMFDRTWYGFEPISSQEFQEYRQRVENIKNL